MAFPELDSSRASALAALVACACTPDPGPAAADTESGGSDTTDDSGNDTRGDSETGDETAVDETADTGTPADGVALPCGETVTDVISAADGGVLELGEGMLTFTVPPGALADDTEISICRVGPPEEFGFDFRPEGLQFLSPAVVSVAIDSPPGTRMGDGLSLASLVLSDGAEPEFSPVTSASHDLEADRFEATYEMTHFSYGRWFHPLIAGRVEHVETPDVCVGEEFLINLVLQLNPESTRAWDTVPLQQDVAPPVLDYEAEAVNFHSVTLHTAPNATIAMPTVVYRGSDGVITDFRDQIEVAIEVLCTAPGTIVTSWEIDLTSAGAYTGEVPSVSVQNVDGELQRVLDPVNTTTVSKEESNRTRYLVPGVSINCQPCDESLLSFTFDTTERTERVREPTHVPEGVDADAPLATVCGSHPALHDLETGEEVSNNPAPPDPTFTCYDADFLSVQTDGGEADIAAFSSNQGFRTAVWNPGTQQIGFSAFAPVNATDFAPVPDAADPTHTAAIIVADGGDLNRYLPNSQFGIFDTIEPLVTAADIAGAGVPGALISIDGGAAGPASELIGTTTLALFHYDAVTDTVTPYTMDYAPVDLRFIECVDELCTFSDFGAGVVGVVDVSAGPGGNLTVDTFDLPGTVSCDIAQVGGEPRVACQAEGEVVVATVGAGLSLESTPVAGCSGGGHGTWVGGGTGVSGNCPDTNQAFVEGYPLR